MVPRPLVLGLTLCDYALVEEGTKKVSLIGAFSGIRAASFPFFRPSFCVFASLTDGEGDADVDLTVTHLESDEEVYFLQRSVRFPGRFTEVRTLFRIADCRFPAAGAYFFTLRVDREWVAHRRIQVYPSETEP